MAELLDVFKSYNDPEVGAYYTFCYNTLPSRLSLEIPLEATKANMESVVEIIGFSAQQLEIVYQQWDTENNSNADFSKDFPYQYLLKSSSKRLMLWISLSADELVANFFYDISDEELETWAIDTNHKLRSKFGLDRAPVFKVLSRSTHSHFYTEDVKTNGFLCDIPGMYNDDFAPVNELIEASLTSDKAGLILLHGSPGTGKTSYIKNLITKFDKRSFIFLQNEFVNELLNPDFISFLLKNRNAILLIEDAEKVLTTREYSNENSVVSTILQLTDGLFSDYLNIKIICTFNTSIEKIDKALLRKGRMIAYYDFKPLVAEKASELLKSMGLESTEDELTLADIFNYRSKEFQTNDAKKIGF
jgi:hypothetical protein